MNTNTKQDYTFEIFGITAELMSTKPFSVQIFKEVHIEKRFRRLRQFFKENNQPFSECCPFPSPSGDLIKILFLLFDSTIRKNFDENQRYIHDFFWLLAKHPNSIQKNTMIKTFVYTILSNYTAPQWNSIKHYICHDIKNLIKRKPYFFALQIDDCDTFIKKIEKKFFNHRNPYIKIICSKTVEGQPIWLADKTPTGEQIWVSYEDAHQMKTGIFEVIPDGPEIRYLYTTPRGRQIHSLIFRPGIKYDQMKMSTRETLRTSQIRTKELSRIEARKKNLVK
ncbi:hypothetical protein DID78_04415 [Candidatus Marinamargulisbacteria bacterium SCGC AG-343-D04]|nr:hypothetical protein DID78_04415 [Candidatus Marinamargulisbacteria bacterium SCGC AG-343-D04]